MTSALEVAYLLARDPVLWWEWERLEEEVDRPMMETAATLEDVPAEVWIADGRVQMSTNTDAGRLSIQTPELQPLSVHEPELTLFLSGDDVEVTVTLTPDQADALREVLEAGVDE